MAYVTPPTFVSGDTLTAAQLNILGDDIVYLKAAIDAMAFTAVSLSRTTNLTVATSTWTDVSWDSASIDTSSFWSSGASVTVPASAIPSGATNVVFAAQVQVRFAANGTGSRAVQVLKNGSTVERARYLSGIMGETTEVDTFVWSGSMAASDVFKLQVYQSSGGNLVANSISAKFWRIGYI